MAGDSVETVIRGNIRNGVILRIVTSFEKTIHHSITSIKTSSYHARHSPTVIRHILFEKMEPFRFKVVCITDMIKAVRNIAQREMRVIDSQGKDTEDNA